MGSLPLHRLRHLTIMIIAMLFMLELVPLQGRGQAAAPSAGDPLPPRVMRPIIFCACSPSICRFLYPSADSGWISACLGSRPMW
ncbi:hypothetical protein [Bilophila wadsworthia]|uniref:hypothetical protein n=1 Tax=Bilophila wadsworthia TaxID=35833 RepID=UPI00242D1C26|nr:hypothetical protein [Bilophila wadsworthia]